MSMNPDSFYKEVCQGLRFFGFASDHQATAFGARRRTSQFFPIYFRCQSFSTFLIRNLQGSLMSVKCKVSAVRRK